MMYDATKVKVVYIGQPNGIAKKFVPMTQGEWLFEANRIDKWKVNVVCSCCKKVIDKAYKYSNEKHQEDFKRENPYCCKCGAKME